MDQVLSTWKEIANYLGKGVRTVQRWEKTLGLPVHRPGGPDHNAIIANTRELSEWMLGGRRRKAEQNRIKTILLVDDDAPLRFVTRALLEDMGYIVVGCADGQRAVDLFENGPQIDLLVTDLQMPGMTGIELAKRLTDANPELPVIVLSGTTPHSDAMGAIERRNWIFVAKPIGTRELLSTVNSALNLDGAQQTGRGDGHSVNAPGVNESHISTQLGYLPEFKSPNAA